MGEFRYEGHRIEYDSYGEGERLLVLVHGLLMNRRMFERLGPALARRGNRVVCVDLLGHGCSDRPEDLRHLLGTTAGWDNARFPCFGCTGVVGEKKKAQLRAFGKSPSWHLQG